MVFRKVRKVAFPVANWAQFYHQAAVRSKNPWCRCRFHRLALPSIGRFASCVWGQEFVSKTRVEHKKWRDCSSGWDDCSPSFKVVSINGVAPVFIHFGWSDFPFSINHPAIDKGVAQLIESPSNLLGFLGMGGIRDDQMSWPFQAHQSTSWSNSADQPAAICLMPAP